ncbi:MAG: glycoside hydrolase family 36 N-terminal domain-containing protein, partial [Erysipelotrichaceae bacterium]|nr:glycoside hydrolase family 36 N-terminal domain-containing protein [Erysipelotrichaceae bacterium]
MESIQFKDHTFLLNTKDLSYMFRIDRYQHLEHLHFGARCRIEDGDAFSFKKYISHGDTIAYAREDSYYSTDSLPQEFPTYGTGDFNEVPIEIEHQASHTLDLIFDSYEILNGDLKMESLPSSYGCGQTLLIHMKDKVKPIFVDLIYAIYPEENIISRRAVLKNLSEEDLVIRKFLSYSIDLCEDDLVLMDFHGAW